MIGADEATGGAEEATGAVDADVVVDGVGITDGGVASPHADAKARSANGARERACIARESTAIRAGRCRALPAR